MNTETFATDVFAPLPINGKVGIVLNGMICVIKKISDGTEYVITIGNSCGESAMTTYNFENDGTNQIFDGSSYCNEEFIPEDFGNEFGRYLDAITGATLVDNYESSLLTLADCQWSSQV